MASLALGVRFNPVSAGTADFVYSSAVTGYRAATVLTNGKVYRYRAESADLSEWEFGTGIWSTATNTLSRNTVNFSSTGSKVSFTLAPQVAITIAPDDVLAFDDAMTLTSVQQAQARSNLAVPIQGYIFGLTLSTAGSSNGFGIAAGQAANSTAIDLMVLASAYTKTTGAWAVGSGNGALDTSSIAANTWYHVYLIKRPDTGVVDVLISTSVSAPVLPTNYTEFRRIGSMRTEASSQWLKFSQLGDDFIWNTAFVDRATSVVGSTAAQTLALSVPPGIQFDANISVLTAAGTDTEGRGLVTSLDKADESTSAALNVGFSGPNGTTSISGLSVRTNVSGQIRYRVASTLSSIQIITFGWRDPRGRLS